jgi:biopolymer transport protein ExbD
VAAWDIFLSESAQVERNVSGAELRRGVESGRFQPDDQIRPAGSTLPWTPLRRVPALSWPSQRPDEAPAPPPRPPSQAEIQAEEAAFEAEVEAEVLAESQHALEAGPGGDEAEATPEGRPPSIFDDEADSDPAAGSALALPVEPPEEDRPFHLESVTPHRMIPPAPLASPDPNVEQPRLDLEAEAMGAEHEAVEDDDEAGFGGGGELEEEEDIDLAAMVDIAMQLIMFFLITSTTVYFRSLEIPTPDPEKQKSATQASARSLQELEDTNILVEVDGRGQFTVDHEPIVAEALIPKLRAARDNTGRTAVLLMVDAAAKHRTAVRVIEAASEIGLATRIGRTGGGGGPGG